MDEDPRGRFERMWTRHHPRVLAYARRRAPADVADEVAAEAFAVAWRRLGDVPPDAGPWLLGVARNLPANRAREVGVATGVPAAMASARIHRPGEAAPGARRRAGRPGGRPHRGQGAA